MGKARLVASRLEADAASEGMSAPELKRAMGLWDLVLFNLTAVVALRWLATAARTGPSSLTLWALAALLFFLPQGLAVLSLATRYPEEGGIYRWTRRAFGDFHGFFCGWCYCVSNLVYYPSLLIFAAGTAAYVLGPDYQWLSQRHWFTAPMALALLWTGIGANLRGLDVGKWVHNLAAICVGLPAMLLVTLAAAHYWRAGSANPLSAQALTPTWDLGTVSFWSTIAFAFAGLELAPVMSGEIRDPRRLVPKALYISAGLIALVYMAGTAAVLVVVPAAEVNVVTGPLQTMDAVARRAGLGSATPLVAALLAAGALGQTAAWLAGSARIPFVAGLDRFLPPAFAKVHPRWRTPHVALLAQGALASLFLLLSLPGGTVAETYLLLAELAVIIYFVPYLYLFLCMIRLRESSAIVGAGLAPPGAGQHSPELIDDAGAAAFAVPGGKAGAWVAGLAGMATALVAIVVSLIPSAEVASPWLYEAKLLGGTALFFGAGLLLYTRRRVTL